MAITARDINILTPGFKAIFDEAFRARASSLVYPLIATEVESTSESEDYRWLGDIPSMRLWEAERQINDVRGFSYTVQNKLYEATIGVERTVIEDDRLNLIRPRLTALGDEAARYIDQALVEYLTDGTTRPAYDGVAFFSASRVAGDSTINNIVSGALSADTLNTAMARMMSFRSDRGKPLGIIPDTLVVGPALQLTASNILEAGYFISSDTEITVRRNVLQGRLNLIVTPYITDDSWFVLCTNRGIRPLILQWRTRPELESLEAESESAFMRDVFLYGVRARFGLGYTYPQLAVMGTGS